MHLDSVVLLLFIASLEVTWGAPRASADEGMVGSSIPVCSADTSDAAVVDFAKDLAWAQSMLGCVDQLNSPTWDGCTATPTDAQNNPLGPPFGFYKGNENFAREKRNGFDCYQACFACLYKGIGQKQAVTTSCTWEAGNGARVS